MITLPESTKYGRRIPKNKFYQNLNLSKKVKKQFIDEIDTLIWQNKISPDTIGISPGEEVIEIEVIEIQLHQRGISKNILEIIDRGIPYHLLFILTFGDVAQFAIGYKEKIKKKDDKYRVEGYYFSEWVSHEDLTIELKGLNLDRIYENLIRQFIPSEIPQAQTLKDTIILHKEIEKQTVLCALLEKKVKSEKQFNIQVSLNHELRKEKIKLDCLKSDIPSEG